MNEDEIKAMVLREIGNIAPEADLQHIDPEVNLREQLDLDSMDALNIMIGLHETTGVDIPEADYPQLTTLTRCIAYLRARMKSA